jgi:hypothetical protein
MLGIAISFIQSPYLLINRHIFYSTAIFYEMRYLGKVGDKKCMLGNNQKLCPGGVF